MLKAGETEVLMEDWANHILEIQQRRDTGCRFGPDDLTESEWRGLSLLDRVISEVRAERK